MKKIVRYKTSDGKIFESESEALEHEKTEKIRKVLEGYSLDYDEFKKTTEYLGIGIDWLLDFGTDQVYLFEEIRRVLKRQATGELSDRVSKFLSAVLDIYYLTDHD